MIKTGSVEERPQGRGAHKISLLNRRTVGDRTGNAADQGRGSARKPSVLGEGRDRSGRKDRQHTVFGGLRSEEERRIPAEPAVPVSG